MKQHLHKTVIAGMAVICGIASFPMRGAAQGYTNSNASNAITGGAVTNLTLKVITSLRVQNMITNSPNDQYPPITNPPVSMNGLPTYIVSSGATIKFMVLTPGASENPTAKTSTESNSPFVLESTKVAVNPLLGAYATNAVANTNATNGGDGGDGGDDTNPPAPIPTNSVALATNSDETNPVLDPSASGGSTTTITDSKGRSYTVPASWDQSSKKANFNPNNYIMLLATCNGIPVPLIAIMGGPKMQQSDGVYTLTGYLPSSKPRTSLGLSIPNAALAIASNTIVTNPTGYPSGIYTITTKTPSSSYNAWLISPSEPNTMVAETHDLIYPAFVSPDHSTNISFNLYLYLAQIYAYSGEKEDNSQLYNASLQYTNAGGANASTNADDITNNSKTIYGGSGQTEKNNGVIKGITDSGRIIETSLANYTVNAVGMYLVYGKMSVAQVNDSPATTSTTTPIQVWVIKKAVFDAIVSADNKAQDSKTTIVQYLTAYGAWLP